MVESGSIRWWQHIVLIGILILITAENQAMQTYDWLPTECAPRHYPVEILQGDLLFSDGTSVYIPDRSLVSNGWGEMGRTHAVGADLKPLPTRLQLTWFSFLENAFFTLNRDLDSERLVHMFAQGVTSPINGKQISYDTVVVGMAPGGHVSLWLATEGLVHELEAFEAEPTQISAADFVGEFEIDLDAYIKLFLSEAMSEEELKSVRAMPIPVGLYQRYRNRYQWSLEMAGGAQPVQAWIRFLNGERYRVTDDVMSKSNHWPVPRSIDLDWDWRGEAFVARIALDHQETLTAFERLVGDTPERKLTLRLELGDAAHSMHVSLTEGRLMLPLEKSTIEIYRR